MLLMIISVVTAGILGFVFGGGLAFASKVFHVEKDHRIDELTEILPGANCGACGFAGCSAYAEAIILQDASISLCTPGGEEVIKKIADYMGQEAEEVDQNIAYVKCKGGEDITTKKAVYYGIEDCRAANLIAGGEKDCEFGCLGYGSCIEVCPFDAIKISENGIPIISEKKCTGCGECIKVCPKNIIEYIPKYNNKVYLACQNHDRGKTVKDICEKGCISCRICEKKCPVNAIKIENNLPVIDFKKCTSCGICVAVCPRDSFFDRVKKRSRFFIDTKCVGCSKCVNICPVNAISGKPKEKFVIDKNKCIGCGLCISECPVKAIGVMSALAYSDDE